MAKITHHTDAMRKAGFQFEEDKEPENEKNTDQKDIFGRISQPFNVDDRNSRPPANYKPGKQ